jgi:hypothetical protein
MLWEKTQEVFRGECHCDGKIRKRMQKDESERKNPNTHKSLLS